MNKLFWLVFYILYFPSMKHWYHANIERLALENTNFRKVLYTSEHMQLVLMTLHVGEEIWWEIHHDNDQFFRIESGEGKCKINGVTYDVHAGSAIIIPAWAEHNIINVSDTQDLTMYTIYTPPHHKDGIIRKTKQDAIDYEEEFDGKTTE